MEINQTKTHERQSQDAHCTNEDNSLFKTESNAATND